MSGLLQVIYVDDETDLPDICRMFFEKAGITFHEDGEQGKDARSGITVPEGVWCMSPDTSVKLLVFPVIDSLVMEISPA